MAVTQVASAWQRVLWLLVAEYSLHQAFVPGFVCLHGGCHKRYQLGVSQKLSNQHQAPDGSKQ